MCFLLPILELAIPEVRRLLRQELLKRGLPLELLNLFPIEEVVVTGLESHSERWRTLALAWAEDLPVSSKLQGALENLRSDTKNQRLRHAAQSLLARQSRLVKP